MGEKRNLTLLTAIAAAAAFASTAQAAPITAPTDGYTGAYRLMFITTAMTVATSTNIDDYNAIADTAGDTVLAGDWKVLGGTGTVGARTNTGALATGDAGYSAAIDVPIYTTNGVRVADNNATIWNGEMLTRLYNQTGAIGGFNQSIHVGFSFGGDIPASGGSFQPLGSTGGTVAGAISSRTAPSYMYGNHSTAPSTPLSLIALSEVIGSGTTPAADPEITSIVKSGNTVTMEFTGTDGETYDLNKATGLDGTFPDNPDSTPNVTTLSGPTSGTLIDTGATEDAAFYQVKQQP